MTLYAFRPKYYTGTGVDISKLGYPIFYISPINRGGTGTRNNPYNSLSSVTGSNTYVNILANGVYRNIPVKMAPGTQATVRYYMVGQHMRSTLLHSIFDINNNDGNAAGYSYVYANDVCFANFDIILKGATRRTYFSFSACWLKSSPTYVDGSTAVLAEYKTNKCIIEFPNNSANHTDSGQNSYLNTDIVNIINSLALYDNCRVTLDTQARLTSYLATYAAFNDCSFKIGNESDWTVLAGTTEAELRANFVARCQAQGFTVPVGSEFGDTDMYMYRWVFANNASANGVPVMGGIVHLFEQRRFVSFGYETKRDGFTVSSSPMKDSFNPDTPSDGLEVNNNAITFPATTDITDRVVAVSQSNIKWLGGKYKITSLDVIHNMAVDFGIMIDNTSTIDFEPISAIAADELYIVRSTDKEFAQISYNGVTYDSSVANKNYIFKGVGGVTDFSITQGNAVVYLVTDFVQHQTFELRIVNKLPSEIITTGNLLENYWYFVEHDSDQNNATDYVTYNGKKYYSGSSFLVQGANVSFTITGNIHLRRCWKDVFDFDTETIDKAHWQLEQKPKWCKLVIGDTPRCFMMSNSDREKEMRINDNGEYMTTGHPDFYKQENGDSGIITPSFAVQGTYMQIRLTATTVNPM